MSMVEEEMMMLNLTKLDEVQVAEILEANGYNSDGILDAEYIKTNDRGDAVYKTLWHDEYTDEFGSSQIYFRYMVNGTIWAEF